MWTLFTASVILDDMTSSLVWSLLGGMVIGVAASVALLGHGRIAGISGTVARATHADGGASYRLPFLAGLVLTGLVARWCWPGALGAAVAPMSTMVVAGLLVGIGTGLANGCTSGHGVCGLARLSPRSLAAVVTFLVTGAITVAVAGALS